MRIALRNAILFLTCLHLVLRHYTVTLSHLQALRCKANLLRFPYLQTCHTMATLLIRVHHPIVSPPGVVNMPRTIALAAYQHPIARLASEIIRNSRQQIADFPKAYAPFQGPNTTDQGQILTQPSTHQTKHKSLILTMSLVST